MTGLGSASNSHGPASTGCPTDRAISTDRRAFSQNVRSLIAMRSVSWWVSGQSRTVRPALNGSARPLGACVLVFRAVHTLRDQAQQQKLIQAPVPLAARN